MNWYEDIVFIEIIHLVMYHRNWTPRVNLIKSATEETMSHGWLTEQQVFISLTCGGVVLCCIWCNQINFGWFGYFTSLALGSHPGCRTCLHKTCWSDESTCGKYVHKQHIPPNKQRISVAITISPISTHVSLMQMFLYDKTPSAETIANCINPWDIKRHLVYLEGSGCFLPIRGQIPTVTTPIATKQWKCMEVIKGGEW